MSIFHALYKTYLQAENNGQVDRPDLDSTGRNNVILPIYHTNLRSDGGNILQLSLNADGRAFNVQLLPTDVYTVFPITEESLNRTSNIAAHPLCDDMHYLSQSLHPGKYEDYCKQNNVWTEGMIEALMSTREAGADALIQFLTDVRELVCKQDVVEVARSLLLQQYHATLGSGHEIEIELKPATEKEKAVIKKINLDKVFVTFAKQVPDVNQRDISVSGSQLLHQAHICLMQKLQIEHNAFFDTCDISGQTMYCTNRNRGLMGKAKMVSVSNNTETYRGRFIIGEEVIRIGAVTSEKMHLMLKYFLEHEDNRQWLYSNTTAVTWFAEDLFNEKHFSLYDPIPNETALNEEEEEYELLRETTLEDVQARKWNAFLSGKTAYTDASENDFFYLAMVNKISPGRLSIQTTRILPVPIFVQNLRQWRDSCSWEKRNAVTNSFEVQTPRPFDIIRYVYGIENADGKIECLKDELKNLAFKRLMPAIIDGAPLPPDMARQMFSNFKSRKNYKRNWYTVRYMTCALLNKVRQDQGKERRSLMLERGEQTRDYLYGRLLAVFEKIENEAVTVKLPSEGKTSEQKGKEAKKNRDSTLHVSNAEKVWAAYFQTPEKTLSLLTNKIQPYLKKLKCDKPGRYVILNQLLATILTEIRETKDFNENNNKALKEDAVFGYYAQNKAFYTSQNN